MQKEIKLAIIVIIFLALGAKAYFLLAKKESSVKSTQSFNEPVIEISKDKNLLEEFIKEVGVKNVMDRLVHESEGGTKYDCHQYAHQVGRLGYFVEKERVFQNCTADCESGCYHGGMEGLFVEKGTDNLATNITELCDKFPTSFGKFSCLHGSGHGIMYSLDYDMPLAIKKCQEFPDWFSKSSCYGGVFMENIMIGQNKGVNPDADHDTDWLNQTDPLFPCNAVDQDYSVQYECYQMQTAWMLTLEKYDFNKIAKDCLQAPDIMKPVCFKSFGRDAVGNVLRDPKKTLELCAKVPKIADYYDQCISGAVNVIVEYQGANVGDQASNLCKMLEENHKKSCYRNIAVRLPGLSQDKNVQRKVCSSFETNYQQLCFSMISSPDQR